MTVQPVPEGYTTVTPWIITPDTAQLIDYVKQAFNAEEIARVLAAGNRIDHAEVRIGDSVVMMFDSRPGWPPTPAFLRLYVHDADATHRQAVAAGGTSVTDVTHLFFGDCVGRVRDPLGNIWWIQTHIEDLSPDEMLLRAPRPVYLAAMKYVQSTLETAFR
jgi:PhnB protein